jgi:hypothetical protein
MPPWWAHLTCHLIELNWHKETYPKSHADDGIRTRDLLTTSQRPEPLHQRSSRLVNSSSVESRFQVSFTRLNQFTMFTPQYILANQLKMVFTTRKINSNSILHVQPWFFNGWSRNEHVIANESSVFLWEMTRKLQRPPENRWITINSILYSFWIKRGRSHLFYAEKNISFKKYFFWKKLDNEALLHIYPVWDLLLTFRNKESRFTSHSKDEAIEIKWLAQGLKQGGPWWVSREGFGIST